MGNSDKTSLKAFTLIDPVSSHRVRPTKSGTDKLDKAFTLIELLIVIAILAILGSAVVVVLNPAELLAEARDNQRNGDLVSVVKSIDLVKVDNPSVSLGVANTVYVSIPYDNNTNCDYPTTNPLGLPTLPAGWSYRCASNADYRRIDGAGWLPVNFAGVSTGSPLTSLPIDPINAVNGGNYYLYYTNGSGLFEINSKMESEKYNLVGALDRVSTDGGDDFTKFEKGTGLAIAPWSFEFSYFTLNTANNNKPGWFTYEGSGVMTTGIDGDGTTYLRSNGYSRYSWQENIPFNPSATYKMTCRIRQVTDPTSGGKSIYCGWFGVAGDSTTYVNVTGANSYGSQNYHVASNATLIAGSGWNDFTGYTSGFGSPNGTTGPCNSQGSPCRVHQSTRFIRPYFLLNYSSGNGIADIDYIRVEKL